MKKTLLIAVMLALPSCAALDCLKNPLSCGIGDPIPQTSPTPKPSATPTPVPTPTPTPVPSPSPSATPAPSPSPSPIVTTPQIDPATGNYPMPAEGVCPAHFANAVAFVGINVLTQRKCAGRDAPPDCTLTVLNATEKSRKPFCPHAPDRLECEAWRPCQQPAIVNGNSGVQMLIASPAWGDTFGDCDKQTTEGSFPDPRLNFLCHDRAENRPGVTRYKACEPDGSRCGPVKEFRSLP